VTAEQVWSGAHDGCPIGVRHSICERALEVVGGGCACWVTPESEWFYYGSAVEPGSQIEYNRACPKHGDNRTEAAL
jgi:hypothetical protein